MTDWRSKSLRELQEYFLADSTNAMQGGFTFSETGMMIYLTGASQSKRRLTWYDADGKELGTLGEPANLTDLALSPDAGRAVGTIINSNDKQRARLNAIRSVLAAIDYEHKDHHIVGEPDVRVVRTARSVTIAG